MVRNVDVHLLANEQGGGGENHWGNRWGEVPYNDVMKVHLNETVRLSPSVFIMTAPSDKAEMGKYAVHAIACTVCYDICVAVHRKLELHDTLGPSPSPHLQVCLHCVHVQRMHVMDVIAVTVRVGVIRQIDCYSGPFEHLGQMARQAVQRRSRWRRQAGELRRKCS